MKNDITTTADIETLVNAFYDQVRENESIGFFFNEIAQVDWSAHLPKMYAFWENVLFGNARYRGNPMLVHLDLNRLSPISEQHFAEWFRLWSATVDRLFQGSRAEEAKTKANSIKELILFKIKAQNDRGQGTPFLL